MGKKRQTIKYVRREKGKIGIIFLQFRKNGFLLRSIYLQSGTMYIVQCTYIYVKVLYIFCFPFLHFFANTLEKKTTKIYKFRIHIIQEHFQ